MQGLREIKPFPRVRDLECSRKEVSIWFEGQFSTSNDKVIKPTKSIYHKLKARAASAAYRRRKQGRNVCLREPREIYNQHKLSGHGWSRRGSPGLHTYTEFRFSKTSWCYVHNHLSHLCLAVKRKVPGVKQPRVASSVLSIFSSKWISFSKLLSSPVN